MRILLAVEDRPRNANQLADTLGLTIFAGLLFVRNLLSLYYYVGHPTLREFFTTQMPALGWQAMVLLHLLETVALVFLLWVTFD